MKKDSISSRIRNGNSLASMLAKYMNKRFGYEFEPVSLEEDMRDMIDFRCAKHQRTAQFKCRENKSDIIFEVMRFFPNYGIYEVGDGRDCRTISQYYCCLSPDKRRVIVAPTKVVKSVAENELLQYEFNQEFISSLVARAKHFSNRSIKLKRNDLGVETWFKIDEGQDTLIYYKILIFIPYESIPMAARFELQTGQELLDETTW